MAIATEQIVTQYLADASGHMRAASQIATAQKSITKAVEETTAATVKNATSASEFLAKWQIGSGSVTGAINLLKSGFRELATVQKFTLAAGSTNIDAMATASDGLIERMDLLRLAASGQTGAFKLNQAQMNTVSGAIRAFVREGREQSDVINKVNDALAKGNGGMLDDFGVILDSTGSKLGDFNALMGALEAKANSVKGAVRTQAEEMNGLGVSFADSMSKFKQSIGEVAIALQPLVEVAARLATTISQGLGSLLTDGQLFGKGGFIAAAKNGTAREWMNNQNTAFSQAEAAGQAGSFATQAQFDMAGGLASRFSAGLFADPISASERANFAKAMAAKKAKRGGGGRSGTTGFLGRFGDSFAGSQDGTIADAEAQRRYTADAQSEADANARDSANQAMNEQLDAAMRSLVDMRNELASVTGTKNPMESILGPIEDMHGYAKAFDMLTGSVSAAMTAWIDGTGNAGEAVRHFIADSLKGAAIEMGIMAIKHGAYALGSLAIGDVAGAALHGKSAAMFAGGAIAAGVAANQLGTSAGDAARGSGGGSQSGGAPSTIGPVQQSGGTIIVYGDPFANDSPRGKQQQAKRLFEMAGEGQGARSN